MISKSFVQYAFRLTCAWFITVASISLSINYLNSLPRYHGNEVKFQARRLSAESNLNAIRRCTPCSNTHQSHPHQLDVSENEIDIERWIPPIGTLYNRLGIVTAISDNHYEEALPAIASYQEFAPNKTIIVYNLGLNTSNLQKVIKLCNVEVRDFPFSSYPKHVKHLHTYAWKPIIIDKTLREFGAIFWGDSSIRLRGSLRDLIPISLKHHGYMTHFHAFDPKKKEEIEHQYFFTHPKLYSNLGVNRTEYYNSEDMAPHAAANRQFYLNSSYIQARIVQPMLKCALQYRCISPVGAHLPKHRFDASVLAILIYKNLRGEWTRKNNDNRYFDKVAYLRKSTIGKEKVRICS